MLVKPKIQVAIRKRPLTERELKKKTEDIIEVIKPNGLFLKEERKKVDLTKYIEEHAFKFDGVFDEFSTNQEIYKDLLQPLVEFAFKKRRVSCFAYGQTGTGKTYTMMGDLKNNVKGLYLLAAEDIFDILEKKDLDLRVGISFYEIYCGRAYDLLNDREECPIRVDKKDNVNIIGLNEKYIGSSDSLMSLITIGLSERVTGKTGMNNASSRSHAILQITLRNSESNKLHGKLSFIDLAGSERGADVKDTDKQTRMDGAEINKSLLALKECIRALDLGKKHLPFRGSKLTLVLKDSFIGKSNAIMIGNISPALDSCEHTLNTLRYADRVKSLKSGDRKKGKNLADELMLARNKNNRRERKIEKPKVDGHIVFEEYDVGNKSVKSKKSGKSQKSRKSDKNKNDEIKRDEKNNRNGRNKFQYKNSKSSRENLNQKLNFNTKLNFQKKSFLLKKDKSSSIKKKNNFLNTMTKKNLSKSPLLNLNFTKNESDNRINFKNSKSQHNSKQNLHAMNFLNSSSRGKSPYHKKKNLNYENLGETKDDLIKNYTKYVDEVFAIAKSDMRNIQAIRNSDDFESNFRKMKNNLDRKIRAINKIKKEIVKVSEIIKKKEAKRISISDNDFLIRDIPDDDNLLI